MGERTLPRAGTVERAVWDAMHAVWCGPDCEPTCRQWAPNRREQIAAIAAVRAFDAADHEPDQQKQETS